MCPITAALTMMKQKAAVNSTTPQLNKYFSPKVMTKVAWHPSSKKV